MVIMMTENRPTLTSIIALLRRSMSLCVLIPGLLLCASSVSASVIYQVTFTGTWNASDMTGALPGGAHFTQLVGATHVDGQPLWGVGALATLGIERVAEVGNPTVLNGEISAAITAGTAATAFQTAGMNSFPNSTSSTFEVFNTHPFVTAISMIAPSPDWFVGISNLALKSGGHWITDQTIDLTPWDAGTEEGVLFSLSNPASSPHVAIAAPVGSPFTGSPVIGTVRFQLTSVPVPAALWLFGSGLFGLTGVQWRRSVKKIRPTG